MVTSPLNCPGGTTIQAPSTRTSGSNPPFRIYATSAFSSGGDEPTVMKLQGACHISGVAIDAGGFTLPATTNSFSSGATTLSLTMPVTVQAGTRVVGANIAAGTYVTASVSGSTSVTISVGTTGMSSGETVTFYGPDGVHVDGGNVVIDDHSLITNGYYNVDCGAESMSGTRLNDAQFAHSISDNLSMGGCANTRIIGDVITDSGGRGVVFDGADLTVADGVIEQSADTGLDLIGATKVSVNDMFFDDNGKLTGGPAIRVKNNTIASICANHFTGNGGPTGSQILFDGPSDGLSFCGNSYGAESQNGDVTYKPSYVYNTTSDAVLTNTNLYESPAPQVQGIYAPGAAKLLSQLQVPHIFANYLSGLTLSNDVSTPTQVNVDVGEAADSGSSNVIQNKSSCPVNLAMAGPHGLDATSSLTPSTTYFYFLIASTNGANPSCIASTGLTPSFAAASFSQYQTAVTGNIFAGESKIYNVSSLAGIVRGTPLEGSFFAGSTPPTVSDIGTVTVNLAGTPALNGSGNLTITVSNSLAGVANLRVGMIVSDGVSNGVPSCTPMNAVSGSGNIIISIGPGAGSGTTTITLNGPPVSGVSLMGNDCANVSGGIVLTMSSAANTTKTYPTPASLTFDTGLYRLIGALYTNPNNTNVVPFHQDGDTFYLATPVLDINAGTGCFGTVPQTCTLSVPCGVASCGSPGIQVEAFGRIVGGTSSKEMLLYSPDQNTSDTPAQEFTVGAPGYTAKSTSPNASFPFRLYTNKSGKLRVIASTGTTTAYEVTDGWAFHRGQ